MSFFVPKAFWIFWESSLPSPTFFGAALGTKAAPLKEYPTAQSPCFGAHGAVREVGPPIPARFPSNVKL